MMIIYKTTNLINNKFYIGLDSKNIPSYLGGGIHVARAVKKYGKENFKKEILETCNSIEELSEREIFWIKKLSPSYNIAKGGYYNIDPSEETRKKLSKALSGKNNPMYGRIGKLNPFFGKTHSKETKRKIGKINKGNKYNLGKKLSEEIKKKISENHANVSGRNNPMFGKKRADVTGENNPAKRLEVRKKISESKKGIQISDEHKRKISKKLKGRIPWNKGKTGIYSEETLKKIGVKKGNIPWNKGESRSEKTKKKISNTRKERIKNGLIIISDETRKKMSCSQKERFLETKD